MSACGCRDSGQLQWRQRECDVIAVHSLYTECRCKWSGHYAILQSTTYPSVGLTPILLCVVLVSVLSFVLCGMLWVRLSVFNAMLMLYQQQGCRRYVQHVLAWFVFIECLNANLNACMIHYRYSRQQPWAWLHQKPLCCAMWLWWLSLLYS